MPEYLCKKELAARLGVSYRTVTEWMAAKRISYVKIGGTVRFDVAQVQADLARNTVKGRRAA